MQTQLTLQSTVLVYAAIGNEQNPAIIFTSLTLFNLLRMPLMMRACLSLALERINELTHFYPSSHVALDDHRRLQRPRPPYRSASIVARLRYSKLTPNSQGIPRRGARRDVPAGSRVSLRHTSRGRRFPVGGYASRRRRPQVEEGAGRDRGKAQDRSGGVQEEIGRAHV